MEALSIPDPDVEMEKASRLLDIARVRWTGKSAEAYLRTSARVRAMRGVGSAPPCTDEGLECGLAARVRNESRGTTGFAAASGAGDSLALWAFGSAAGHLRTDSVPIALDLGGAPAPDRDPDLVLPTPGVLREWLVAVQERLKRAAVTRSGTPPRVEWVEAGVTVESLVTHEGFRTSRARRRVWALSRHRRGGLADAADHPRILAAGSLDSLDPSALVAGIDSAAGSTRLGSGRALGPIVLEPEAAAVLTGFLVQALHRSAGSLSTRVGKGWRLRDDPVASGALVGGAFDDVGFPARPLELADGDFVTGFLDGPGHYRRPSFRDPPEAMAAHLVLETGVAELPSEGCFVSDVRVVPLDAARCTLWVDGRRHRGGVPAESFVGARVRTSPRELVRSVAAAAGPQVRTAAGVVTPHLVLSGLTLDV